MPLDTTVEHFATEFSANWLERIQQEQSRLAGWVESESFMGERKRYDRIGASSFVMRTERAGPTPISNNDMDFRWCYRNNYHDAKILDRQDAQNLAPLALPSSRYMSLATKAYNRQHDDIVCATALGSVITGENGNTSTVLPVGQQIAHGGTGLTIAKLMKAAEILNINEIDSGTPRVMVVHSKQITDMLALTEVRSADYNTIKALVAGEVDSFMGFKFVINNRLTKVSTTRSCVAFTKGAIQIMRGGLNARVDQLPQQSYAWQFYYEFDLSGTRLHDEGVIQIDCTETP